jgi:hypothetical protein
MKFEEEFKTVDLLISSELPTRMVDAFSLSVIKAERQMRKLFSYIAFQNKNLTRAHVDELRNVLAGFRNIYFAGFISGIDELSNRPLSEIYGNQYESNLERLNKAISYRNKIFHGQLTNEKLSSADLLSIINNIKLWCRRLSEVTYEHYGYCGFGRNSFQKASKDLSQTISMPISDAKEYKKFIKTHMGR